jgi:DNA polymerase I-like protein with 3'-5' exonuclease and polymerase domains
MIITKLSEFRSLAKEDIWVLDLESKGTDYHDDAVLMGIGIYFPDANESCYVPVHNYSLEEGKVIPYTPTEDALLNFIVAELPKKKIVCHNASFDIGYLRAKGIDCMPYWCTRVGWHLIAPEDKKVTGGYSLDNAIEKVLEKDSHKEEFAEHIKLRGGSTKNGDHYLADLSVMAEYCENDCKFTYELYQVQKPALERLNAVDFMRDLVLESHKLVWRQEKDGMFFDTGMATKYEARLNKIITYLEGKLYRNFADSIKQVRLDLTKAKVDKAKYKRQDTIDRNMEEENWIKFNFGSDFHVRRLLLLLGVEIKERTDTGLVSLSSETLELYKGTHPLIDAMVSLNELRTRRGFIPQYLGATKDNIYRPSIDLCGTASGRIVAYKPNIVAVNRRDKGLMKCFKAREGYSMVQYDYSNIEPRIEASFTMDEELKEIVVEGRDMYLELCRYVFPDKVDLYDINDLEGSKERLSKERDILKTVRLGLGYGMGAPLLASKIGSTVEEARRIFSAYWDARHKAKNLENQLLNVYGAQGYASNLYMRPIVMYKTKDILNRLIQSSGHDTLTYFSLNLYHNLESSGLHYMSVLPDVHDEGIYEVRDEDTGKFLDILKSTLAQTNEELDLYVPLEITHKIVKDFSELK